MDIESTTADTGRVPRGRRRLALGAVAALLVLVVGIVVANRGPDGAVETGAQPAPGTTGRPTTTGRVTTTTAAPTTTVTEAPPTTEAPVIVTVPPPPPTIAAPINTVAPTWPPITAAEPVVVAPPPAPAPAPAPVINNAGGGIAPFRGLGVWIDVLDWSPTYTNGAAPVKLASIDRLADLGVQTIYIQSSRFNRPEDILDPGLLGQIIDRAHARGMAVVAWYMPTHEDHGADVRRLVAAANLPVDGVCVNIESQNQRDIDLRNERVLDLTAQLRAATAKPLSAVVVPPVVTQILNPNYWPRFPWTQLDAAYDAWLPMAYWTGRTPESGWRDGYRYIAENTRLIRQLTGNPNAAVHPVGGIADQIGPADVDAMAQALIDTGAIGGSLYDYVTTTDPLWPSLQAFRR